MDGLVSEKLTEGRAKGLAILTDILDEAYPEWNVSDEMNCLLGERASRNKDLDQDLGVTSSSVAPLEPNEPVTVPEASLPPTVGPST